MGPFPNTKKFCGLDLSDLSVLIFRRRRLLPAISQNTSKDEMIPCLGKKWHRAWQVADAQVRSEFF